MNKNALSVENSKRGEGGFTQHRHVTFQKVKNSKYKTEGGSKAEDVEGLMQKPWLTSACEEPRPLELERIKLPDNQTDFAGVIRNVLTPEECLHLIAMTEKVGYEQATVTTFGDKQVTMTNYRNSSRCIIDSDNLSGVIWERISNLIPNPSQIHSLQREALREGNSETSKSESFLTNITSRLGVGPRESDHWSAYEINHRMRFLRYGSGEYFNRHRDGCYVDRNEDRSRANRRQSWVSFQIYLNEGFEGGATTFMARGENEEQNVSVVPEAGMVVLFSHPIEHQGDLVVSGRKYAIRSDVMYERDGF